MLTKSVLLVVAAQSLVLVAGQTEAPDVNEINAKCQEELHLTEEDVAPLNETRYLDTKDERIKCFVKCFLTGIKIMNEMGDLTLNEASFKHQDFQKHFEECKTVNGTNPCDKAVNFQNCVWKQVDLSSWMSSNPADGNPADGKAEDGKQSK